MIEHDTPTVTIVGRGRIGGSLLRHLAAAGVMAVAIDVEDDLGALAAADLIVESVPEDLPLKQRVIEAVRGWAPSAVVLSTTSSFTAATLAPDDSRVGLWHPFAPLSRRRIVEIASPGYADPDVAIRAQQLAATTGRTWVRSADRPGLIGNRILKRWTHAGLAALDAGAAPDAVDRAFVDAGFVMGPVSVVALVGPATSLAVSESFTATLGRRFAPPAALRLAAEDSAWPSTLAGSTGVPHDVVESALLQVRDEVGRVLDEGVAADASDVRAVLERGLGWPPEIVTTLHAW